MRNALNKMADGVKDPITKKVIAKLIFGISHWSIAY